MQTTLFNRLEEAIADKDRISVKVHLTSFIDKYPANRDNAIIDAFHFAENCFPNFLDEHEGEKFKTDRLDWDDDYFALLMDDLIDNFSKERFYHTIEVSGHLYSKQHPSGDQNSQDTREVQGAAPERNETKIEAVQPEPDNNFIQKIIIISVSILIVAGTIAYLIQQSM